jgi:2-methylcitrate dehydratase PrpD
MTGSVTERLVAFMRRRAEQGIPEDVAHETKRLLINQLKASVGAMRHPTIKALHAWTAPRGAVSPAHTLWFGTATTPENACVINGALFEVLDFHDTYIPTFMHAVSGVLPAVMAAAEVGSQSGADIIKALAIGLEVELAVATILMPTAYYRGFMPAGLVGGIGGAAACSILAGHNETQMRDALGIAMLHAFGTYAAVGSSAFSYLVGATARTGYVAAELAGIGIDISATAFEGDKGMLESYSNEPKEKIDGVLSGLGSNWRIFGQTYKTVPTETITHGPIECALEILGRANGRTVDRMQFHVQHLVVSIADERMARFGNPTSDLMARFDLRFCVAAAWMRGHFTLAEMEAAAYTDVAILDLRSRIDLVVDPNRATFDGCSLEVVFTDGSKETSNVDNFLGTPGNRMSDEQLSAVFRKSAIGTLSADRSEAVLDAAWNLDRAPNIHALMALAQAN